MFHRLIQTLTMETRLLAAGRGSPAAVKPACGISAPPQESRWEREKPQNHKVLRLVFVGYFLISLLLI